MKETLFDSDDEEEEVGEEQESGDSLESFATMVEVGLPGLCPLSLSPLMVLEATVFVGRDSRLGLALNLPKGREAEAREGVTTGGAICRPGLAAFALGLK